MWFLSVLALEIVIINVVREALIKFGGLSSLNLDSKLQWKKDKIKFLLLKEKLILTYVWTKLCSLDQGAREMYVPIWSF